MTSRLLSGHLWHATGPSSYQLASHPVTLVYNGQAWYLSFNGSWANAKPWPSRDSAASAVSVIVRTVVFTSGTAMRRTAAFRTPIARAIRTISA